MRTQTMYPHKPEKNQKGVALFVSLIFLLLLTVVGMASMKSASLQEKMAGNTRFKNISFQLAEAALREAEQYVANPDNSSNLATCTQCGSGGGACVPPDHTTAAAGQGVCDSWTASADRTGFFHIQKLGNSSAAINIEPGQSVTLYRITAVATAGNSTTALESIYATN